MSGSIRGVGHSSPTAEFFSQALKRGINRVTSRVNQHLEVQGLEELMIHISQSSRAAEVSCPTHQPTVSNVSDTKSLRHKVRNDNDAIALQTASHDLLTLFKIEMSQECLVQLKSLLFPPSDPHYMKNGLGHSKRSRLVYA